MAQFDVHRNPGRNRAEIPYVVVLQSARFDDTPRRLVAPLLLADPVRDLRPPPHLPRFAIEGRAVLMDALQLQTLPRRLLAQPVASLADPNSAAAIIAAIDEVISTSYG